MSFLASTEAKVHHLSKIGMEGSKVHHLSKLGMEGCKVHHLSKLSIEISKAGLDKNYFSNP